MRALLLGGLLLIGCMAQAAEIYTYKDEQGRTVFTDKPTPDKAAKPISLSDPNQIAPIATPPATTSTSSVMPSIGHQQISFSNLPEGNAFRANDGNITLRVEVSPALTAHQQLRLLVDGQAVAETSGSSFTLPNLDRGEHQIQLQLLSGGQVVTSSVPETIYILRRHQ